MVELILRLTAEEFLFALVAVGITCHGVVSGRGKGKSKDKPKPKPKRRKKK